jgi:N-acyl-D-amino-acid deacylase
VLGRYVREQNVVALEDAIRKMSSLPAAQFGLKDRGILAERRAADVVLFDPRTVADPASYQNPHQHAAGFPYVIVNGVVVIDAGRLTDERPGRVLRGPAWRKPS